MSDPEANSGVGPSPESESMGPHPPATERVLAGYCHDLNGQLTNAFGWLSLMGPSVSATEADNWALSPARALSVVRFMPQALGVPPDRLAATGFGEYRPVAFGDSDADLARNRRIELKLTER